MARRDSEQEDDRLAEEMMHDEEAEAVIRRHGAGTNPEKSR
jgi:hypothetical protein